MINVSRPLFHNVSQTFRAVLEVENSKKALSKKWSVKENVSNLTYRILSLKSSNFKLNFTRHMKKGSSDYRILWRVMVEIANVSAIIDSSWPMAKKTWNLHLWELGYHPRQKKWQRFDIWSFFFARYLHFFEEYVIHHYNSYSYQISLKILLCKLLNTSYNTCSLFKIQWRCSHCVSQIPQAFISHFSQRNNCKKFRQRHIMIVKNVFW